MSRKRHMQFVFGASPTVSMRRNKFDLSHDLKTSMSVGKLYPLDVQEVLPGDTFKMRETHVIQLSTAYLKPIMDNVYMDMYYFYVPNRIIFDDWENVFGDSSPSAYSTPELSEVPTTNDVMTVTEKTVADYLGLPLGKVYKGINVLPFRAFAKIYDEWFRNENIVAPMYIHKGDFNAQEAFNNNAWSASNYTGQLPFVGKKKDYFTSCLPSPQKGASVSIGTAVLPSLSAPVTTGENRPYVYPNQGEEYNSLMFQTVTSGEQTYGMAANRFFGLFDDTTNHVGVLRLGNDSVNGQFTNNPVDFVNVYPSNLWARIPETALNATNVNDLRLAFQMQKMLEKDARFGTRYREYILGHFGVSNPDGRMQIPEYLGGKRIPLNTQTVTQTNTQDKTAGAVESPLGARGAFSHSVGSSKCFKSFTEHGFILTLGCIRVFHTYQQGIDKFWLRKKREDYYDPLFANLGEQPVYTSELYVPQTITADSDPKANIFGYNEAWADYRYKPSKITGEMRSAATNSFDVYHFGDNYANAPTLTDTFTNETGAFFRRTTALDSSANVDDFVVDFWFDVQRYAVMPLYSVPGLIDHH